MTQPLQRMPEDREWADRLRAGGGDRGAFEELFRAYYDELVAFGTRIVGASDEAEEVVQDVFLSVWRNRMRTELAAHDMAAYLFGAVRKSATSRLRHVEVEKRWGERMASEGKEALLIAPAPASDAQTRFNEVIAAVRVAVDELPPRCRQAFLLRRQHGMSYNEIAQVMGISAKTVEVQIGAALRTLRARLARFYD